MAAKYGMAVVERRMTELLDYAEHVWCATNCRGFPRGCLQRRGFLSMTMARANPGGALRLDGAGGGPIKIRSLAEVRPARAEQPRSISPAAIRNARASANAVYCDYLVGGVLRVPLSFSATMRQAAAGLMRPITVIAPLWARSSTRRPPAAWWRSGNVECSQRITDTLLAALAKAAPARWCLSGEFGHDEQSLHRRTRCSGASFRVLRDYGGRHGRASGPATCVSRNPHAHDQLALNTPWVEALEYFYPFRVRR